MATRFALKQRIIQDIDRADAIAYIDDAIDAAVEHYSRKRFWFLEGRATLTLSSSEAFSGVTPDLKEIDSLLITISGSKTPLRPVSYAEMDEKDDGKTYGDPSEYSFYQNNFRWYPVPNSGLVVTMSYHKSLDAPSDSASNAWTGAGFQLIRFHAEKDIYKHIIGDMERAATAEISESEAFSSLVGENTAKLSTGRIRKSTW